MNDRDRMPLITLSIAAVERDTGLSKDTLRIWERRYGFPAPGRDSLGERAYPLDQVQKLRIVKRLLDAGQRPGRVVPLGMAELQQLAEHTVAAPRPRAEAPLGPDVLQQQIAAVRRHDLRALRAELAQLLARLGVARFVTEVAGPLNAAVGEAWLRGQLEIFEEHLFTESMQVVLRQAIAAVPEPPSASRPRVLLGTFPGEPHGMGLLMAEALLRLEGAECISLGVQAPLWDIVLACDACRADIVALSFTGCIGPNQVVDGLTELRGKLSAATALWAGGSAPVLHRRPVAGVHAMASFDGMADALRRWRSRQHQETPITPGA